MVDADGSRSSANSAKRTGASRGSKWLKSQADRGPRRSCAQCRSRKTPCCMEIRGASLSTLLAVSEGVTLRVCILYSPSRPFRWSHVFRLTAQLEASTPINRVSGLPRHGIRLEIGHLRIIARYHVLCSFYARSLTAACGPLSSRPDFPRRVSGTSA